MKRRQFLLSGTVPLLGSFGKRLPESVYPEEQRTQPSSDIYGRLVRANDAAIPKLLARQEQREGHPGMGGIPDAQSIYAAGAAAGFIKTLSAAVCAPESEYFNSEELVRRMEPAARFLLSVQYQDGNIDLYTTNFHSPPDTAFVVEPLAAAMAVLRSNKRAGLKGLIGVLDRFLRAAGRALTVGGIHTPNHRWVVCSALARLNSLYPTPGYVSRIDDWLGEGIDIDDDGQFTERSTSIYSPTCDNALLTVARLLNRPQLLDPVRRNLAMTLYYMHADGEVATEGSRRQDQYLRGTMAGYYIPYRFFALEEREGKFAAVTRMIEEEHGDELSGSLIYFLENPQLRRELPSVEPLPDNFVRFFPHSDLVRIRRGNVSATILGTDATFFSFHKGAAALQAVRMAAAFFGKGQFQGVRIEEESGRWRLKQSLTAPYYQPLPAEARRADGDWGKMSIARRPQSEVQNLESTVEIREENGKFELQINLSGCDNVPVAVELGFRRGGRLTGAIPVADIEDIYILEKGMGRYTFNGQTIEFGQGRADHRYTQLRGALPRFDAMTVYLTGFTPFRSQLTIA